MPVLQLDELVVDARYPKRQQRQHNQNNNEFHVSTLSLCPIVLPDRSCGVRAKK
jgi:hypothetical protein